MPFNLLFVLLLGSVEPQLFKLTSYLPRALFMLLRRPVMSQPPQNHKEINDSLRMEPRLLHSLSFPAPPRMPACNPLSPSFCLLLSSLQSIQKDPDTSLSIRAYYRAPMLAGQRKRGLHSSRVCAAAIGRVEWGALRCSFHTLALIHYATP